MHDDATTDGPLVDPGVTRDAIDPKRDEVTRDAPAPRATPASRPTVGPQPTRMFGEFQIDAVLGSGGMGVVYRAFHPALGRHVALKVVTSTPGAARAERFAREGQLAAALDHPGIVRVHSAGDVDGCLFLACQLVEDCRTFDVAIKGLDVRRRVELIRDAARALGHAHARGVIHRDVKPSNLLVDAAGTLRIADFGLATGRDAERLTATGAFVGTPGYTPPEQMHVTADGIGPRADVWALGVVLYEALTGALPFEVTTIQHYIELVRRGTPPPPSARAPEVPPSLDPICMRALYRNPGSRYRNGDAFADALDGWLRGDTAPSRLRPALAGLATALVAVALGLALRSPAVGPDDVPPATEAAAPVTATQVASPPAAPAWFAALAPARRPALPLPPGVAFGADGEYVNARDGSRLVWIPAGEFVMGLDVVVAGVPEGPTHPVRLTRGFFLGKLEVTVAQFERFRDTTGRPREPRDQPWLDDLSPETPAMGVSWDEATAYCAWAGLRLPTEAEWEFGARSSDGRLYPWGNDPPDASRAQTSETAGTGTRPGPLPVGSLPAGASPFGCLDMSGNAYEWVQDAFARYPASSQIDPTGPTQGEGEGRVIRGGAFDRINIGCRTVTRRGRPADAQDPTVGFRVARSHS